MYMKNIVKSYLHSCVPRFQMINANKLVYDRLPWHGTGIYSGFSFRVKPEINLSKIHLAGETRAFAQIPEGWLISPIKNDKA